MTTQWSPIVFQLEQPPWHLYLTQLDIRSLIAYWTHYKIGQSCFFNWKHLLGESTPGKRQAFYSNYLLAKFTRYAELMIRLGIEELAVNELWNELDKYQSLVEQTAQTTDLGEKRQLLQKEYTNAILSGRAERPFSNSPSRPGVRQKDQQIITVPITARAV